MPKRAPLLPQGRPSQLFFSHIAGLQKYLPAAMSLFAPNVNSYRRITRHYSAPINTQWGYDNRTAGLRVPVSNPKNRRVENRIAGADGACWDLLAQARDLSLAELLGALAAWEPPTSLASLAIVEVLQAVRHNPSKPISIQRILWVPRA